MAADDYVRGIDNERRRIRDWVFKTRERLEKLRGLKGKDDWEKGYLGSLADLEEELNK